MKNFFSLLAIAVLSISAISAQDLKPSFGLKIGAEFTEFDNDINTEDATGYHIGAVLHIPLAKKFGLQPEAIYSFSDVDDAFTISTLDIPLLITYKIVPGLRINLGPQVKFDVGSDFDSAEVDALDDFNTLNFDVLAGLEYKFPVIGIFAQARYQIGVTDITEEGDIKENGFLVSVGYRF